MNVEWCLHFSSGRCRCWTSVLICRDLLDFLWPPDAPTFLSDTHKKEQEENVIAKKRWKKTGIDFCPQLSSFGYSSSTETTSRVRLEERR